MILTTEFRKWICDCGGFANTLLATPSSKWNEMNVKKAEGKITARFDFEPRGD